MKQFSFKITTNVFLFAFSFFVLSSSCNKSESTNRPPLTKNRGPFIQDISPKAGPFGTVVTITGARLGDNINKPTVTINGRGALAKVIIPDTKLEIIIPDSADTGPITVKTKSGQTTGPVFNYVYTYTGITNTVAGSGAPAFLDGQGIAARFNSPFGITVDALGNLYVADHSNHRIRKITPAGLVSTVAGSGTPAFADGQGTVAGFNLPTGITIDALGNLYVADQGNHRIRKITPAGLVSTVAGSATPAFADGQGTVARFNSPTGITIDGQGNFYVADHRNHRIRKITPAGLVSTVAGSGAPAFLDGQGIASSFNLPTGITIDAQGNLYVADHSNHRIRKITPAGLVSTVAGSGTPAFLDGQGIAARFTTPTGITIDKQGNFYVADYGNHRIRKITPAGLVSTVAGSGTPSFADGQGAAARFNYPAGITIDGQGNLYVAELQNHRIRKMTIKRH